MPLWAWPDKGVGFVEKPTAPGHSDWRTRFDVSVHVEYSGRVACSAGVLFENSIVCLVVFVCCCFLAILFFPFRGWLFFDASFCWFVVRLFWTWFLFGEFDPGSG